MLAIYPSSMNINMSNYRSKSVNADINIGDFRHDIVEYNSLKSNRKCWLYIPSIHQEPNLLRKIEGANINVDNISFKLFYLEVVITQWKSNIECWLFLPLIAHLYVSTEIS